MAFGRKKKEDEPAPEPVVAQRLPEAPTIVTTGPYDLADVPDPDAPRLDLGSLRVPVPDEAEIRVDVSPEGQVISAVAVHRGSQMQVNAFAAPRREGIWDDVRAEIAESLRSEGGGSADEVDGPFGKELRARIPSGQPGQHVPARFIGADGPRWFVRALLTGPAATDPSQASVLEDVFRRTVVVRGNEAFAPRDGLPLKLPRDAEAAAAQAAEAAAQEGGGSTRDDFNPFERGPEITETR